MLPLLLALSAAPPLPAQSTASPEPQLPRLQAYPDSLHRHARFPGATAAVALPDGRVLALAVGQADTADRTAMQPGDLMLSGSVGKTYVAAVALQLVAEGRLGLDMAISTWLGAEPWFGRLPNGPRVRVRHLMNHTSGIVRYEFKEEFTRDLTANPDKVWTPAERLAYVLDDVPAFNPGEGWDYSDTNYIILGMIIERVTGRPLNEEIRRRLLEPYGLRETVPAVSQTIPGLVQGYAGPGNPFGGTDAMIVNGRMVINPQLEWAGGGYASTAADLVRWAKLLYEGTAVPLNWRDTMLAGVPAPMLGGSATYGLGVIIRPGPLGVIWGHSGFFPGYLTEMRYFPEHRIAVAFQMNTSAQGALGTSPGAVVTHLARLLVVAP